MSKRSRSMWDMQEIIGSVDTARVLMLLAQQSQHGVLGGGSVFAAGAQPVVVRGGAAAAHDRVFECKTCNRQFPTFQALGGHRASHKRPRQQQQQQQALGGGAGDDAGLCLGRQPTPPRPQPAKPRVHECPVCGLEFPIGQALGGHMRRHRAEAEAAATTTTTNVAKAAPVKACDGGEVCLDLNLTPSENCAKCRNVVGLGAAGQGVHKALAMLDCFL